MQKNRSNTVYLLLIISILFLIYCGLNDIKGSIDLQFHATYYVIAKYQFYLPIAFFLTLKGILFYFSNLKKPARIASNVSLLIDSAILWLLLYNSWQEQNWTPEEIIQRGLYSNYEATIILVALLFLLNQLISIGIIIYHVFSKNKSNIDDLNVLDE